MIIVEKYCYEEDKISKELLLLRILILILLIIMIYLKLNERHVPYIIYHYPPLDDGRSEQTKETIWWKTRSGGQTK